MIECAYLPFVSISPPRTRCEDEWEHEMHLFADSRPVVVMADDGVSRWSAAPDAANPTLGRNVYLSFRCHYRYHAIIDPLPVQPPRIFTSLQFFIHFYDPAIIAMLVWSVFDAARPSRITRDTDTIVIDTLQHLFSFYISKHLMCDLRRFLFIICMLEAAINEECWQVTVKTVSFQLLIGVQHARYPARHHICLFFVTLATD